jgi:pyridoxal phosphate enzyme (YggS family)
MNDNNCNNISLNIKKVQEQIKSCAEKYGRNANEVQLLAVSKLQSIEHIEAAYRAGLRDFGENYVQEWKKKSEICSSPEKHLPGIRWHIIGPVQKNKVKYFNSHLHAVQSLHSLELAQFIEQKWAEEYPLEILVQLQVDAHDTQKSGISIQDAQALCKFLSQSKKLYWSGFMGIGPQEASWEKRMELYTAFKKNTDTLASLHWSPREQRTSPILSLGMSGDLEAAIACGSTQVRIGSAIFGHRPFLVNPLNYSPHI